MRVRAIAPAILLAAALPAAAGDFSPKDSVARLTITWKVSGEGDEIPKSKERHVVWKVRETYTATGTLVASAPYDIALVGNKVDAESQALLDARTASAQKAQAAAAPAMAVMEGIMAKCGDDMACVQREAMANASRLNTPQMKTAVAHAQQAGRKAPPRGQTFAGKTFSGTYAVDETAQEAYFDAACGLRNEASCMIETRITGKGALALEGKSAHLGWGSHAQYDAKEGKLSVAFGLPAMAQVTRVVSSKSSDRKSGTTKVLRQPPRGTGDQGVVVRCGECRSVTGTFTYEMKDRIVGRPAKVEVEWQFRRP